MCVGYNEVYVECEHEKPLVILEHCECADGDNCNSVFDINIVWTKKIKAPSVCPECYQYCEEGIFENFRKKGEFHTDNVA